MRDHTLARSNMVESQLRTNKVTDAGILAAFETLPRERFLPAGRAGTAYLDEDIPIAPGRYLLEPMVLARLLQAAAIERGDVVLDIACGSGYSSAVLAGLAGTVVALECDPELAKLGDRLLGELGIDNAVVVEGPLTDGYPKQAPYNAIVFEGAVARVPDAILSQLAEGGRLLAVVSQTPHLGQATLFQKTRGMVSRRVLFDAATPVLPGFSEPARFVF